MQMARRTFNKSEHIREVHRETGLKGKKLAEELQRRNPDQYGKRKPNALATYVYTVLSSSKGKKGKRGARGAAAAANGRAASAPKTRNVPLIDQLRQLAGMIGKDGVKNLVDSL
jgi:hypothetical protein